MLTAPPTVRTGHVLALRLFDAADRIDLEQAEALWRRYAAGARAEVLEIAIVVLILFEVIMAFVRE